MDAALRGAIRRTLVVALVVLALGAGWALHGLSSSAHSNAAPGGRPHKFDASELMRLVAGQTAGIYLQYTGVTGPPGTPYRNDAVISSFSWGVSRQTATTSGTRVGLAPQISEINVQHQMDKYSAPLLQQSLTGQGADAILYFTSINDKTGGLVSYLEIDLSHVLITSFQTSGSGAIAPSESLSLNFTSAVFKVHFAGTAVQTVNITNI